MPGLPNRARVYITGLPLLPLGLPGDRTAPSAARSSARVQDAGSGRTTVPPGEQDLCRRRARERECCSCCPWWRAGRAQNREQQGRAAQTGERLVRPARIKCAPERRGEGIAYGSLLCMFARGTPLLTAQVGESWPEGRKGLGRARVRYLSFITTDW